MISEGVTKPSIRKKIAASTAVLISPTSANDSAFSATARSLPGGGEAHAQVLEPASAGCMRPA